jgi:DNA repair photolyase
LTSCHRLTYINIAATITTVDEAVREKTEPGAATAARRFSMLKEFKKQMLPPGLHLMPIIPLLTDSAENLEALCRQARDCQVDYLLPGTLYLRGKTRSAFFEFIKTEYPDKLGTTAGNLPNRRCR